MCDIRNYMSLIRWCCRERDVEKAMSILASLKASAMKPDKAVFNSVLDVCVVSGDMESAMALFKEMKETDAGVDMVTYNTLIKGSKKYISTKTKQKQTIIYANIIFLCSFDFIFI